MKMRGYGVAPLAGAWIEMDVIIRSFFSGICVAPLAGAWIEIYHTEKNGRVRASLPSRERGLKSDCGMHWSGKDTVAPLAGAWIEIVKALETESAESVAPLAGAWIEIVYP